MLRTSRAGTGHDRRIHRFEVRDLIGRQPEAGFEARYVGEESRQPIE